MLSGRTTRELLVKNSEFKKQNGELQYVVTYLGSKRKHTLSWRAMSQGGNFAKFSKYV